LNQEKKTQKSRKLARLGQKGPIFDRFFFRRFLGEKLFENFCGIFEVQPVAIKKTRARFHKNRSRTF